MKRFILGALAGAAALYARIIQVWSDPVKRQRIIDMFDDAVKARADINKDNKVNQDDLDALLKRMDSEFRKNFN